MTPVERAQRLARMKALALALLVFMFALYLLTGFYEVRYPGLSYVRAFAEAATVGALADWFAVTALFRHPLGIPIPHTAIIQRRKDDIGRTLSRFVADNFLVPDALAPRLERVPFASSLSSWMQRPDNADRLAADLAGVLRRVLSFTDNRALRDLTKESLRSLLDKARLTPLFGQLLEFLLLKDPDQALVNGLLVLARKQLANNRQSLQQSLSDRTPWWLPRFVDRRIFDRLVDELDQYLADTRHKDDDAAKEQLLELLQGLITALKTDPALIQRGEDLKAQVLEHPWLQQHLSKLINDFSSWLSDNLDDPSSDLRQRLVDGVSVLGQRLESDEALKLDLDKSCRDTVLYVVQRYNDSIASVISETVKNWDAQATAERIELQVGRDLQFIRINGTLVGGFVGLSLHLIWKAIGP
ncbi:MAG: DUF445 domain-containing protein [Pseudomonadota bacterium]